MRVLSVGPEYQLTQCSEATKERARSAGVELVPSDSEMAKQADVILSIVPPRDAPATAQRIVKAASNPDQAKRQSPLYFLDLNAVSPQSARNISELFAKSSPDVRLIDGGIIGGPPKRQENGSWNVPSIPVSGPNKLSDAQPSGTHLTEVLNIKHISDVIGQVSRKREGFLRLGD